MASVSPSEKALTSTSRWEITTTSATAGNAMETRVTFAVVLTGYARPTESDNGMMVVSSCCADTGTALTIGANAAMARAHPS